MAIAKTEPIETPARPLIQIDDEVREMNEEEFAAYEAVQAANVPLVTE